MTESATDAIRARQAQRLLLPIGSALALCVACVTIGMALAEVRSQTAVNQSTIAETKQAVERHTEQIGDLQVQGADSLRDREHIRATLARIEQLLIDLNRSQRTATGGPRP